MPLRDWPDPDPDPRPGKPPDFAEFRRMFDWRGDIAGTMLLAKAEDRIVGFCGALGTVVHPAWRGWGIATALEARVIERSCRKGHKSAYGASANPAMRAVYAKLGYHRVLAEVQLIRWLKPNLVF